VVSCRRRASLQSGDADGANLVLRLPFALGAIAALCLAVGGSRTSARQAKLPSPLCESSTSVSELLREGQRLVAEWNRHARRCFERAVPLAEQSGDRAVEAEARLSLARSAYYTADYPVAAEQSARARDLFQALGDQLQVGHAETFIGMTAYILGDKKQARRHHESALAAYIAIDSEADRVSALINIAHSMDVDAPELLELAAEAIARARAIHSPILEARALHFRADRYFSAGRYADAIADLKGAIEGFRAGKEERVLADVYVSLGRVYRAHGQPELAIDAYDRAIEIQQRVGDLRSIVQSTNAKAVALSQARRVEESRRAHEQALAFARRTGVQGLIDLQQANLANAYAAGGDYREAIRLVEDVLPRQSEPGMLARYHSSLAAFYLRVEKFEIALEHANKSLDYGREGSPRDAQVVFWSVRALINKALRRYDDALADARRSVEIVEEIRGQLVPLDFMKRGFGDAYQSIFGLTISLAHARGESDNSLMVSEQARARAFLDLLGSRNDVESGKVASPAGEDMGVAEGLGIQPFGSPPTPVVRTTIASTIPAGGRRTDLALASAASVKTASPEEIAAIARRLKTTLVAYWVNDDEVLAWVVRPGLPTRSARIAVTRSSLEQAARAAIPSLEGSSAASLRRLYDLLIEPLAGWLPPAGSSLTIVPHGPLFRVSFAALLDVRGQYLIERYAVSYAPSVSTFPLTERLAARAINQEGRNLVVADPRPLLRAPDGERFAPLPATLREAGEVGKALGAESTTILSKEQAAESGVRATVGDKRVIHFATHGLIRDDDPFESYLVLGGSGDAAATDGRLTVREIYDLSLKSDIVVLSACRTAAGRPSGDGITGMARALFYAGTPSVVATLWDVADEPSAQLMAGFYSHWRRGLDKRDALRRAQLDLLRTLRKGSLTVRTAQGLVRLDERPFYWAGYVLIGEPF
jgi:CHAT domain-containing protein/tetratricopeptide (TPR) repeat protein